MQKGSTSDIKIKIHESGQLLETANENLLPFSDFSAFLDLEIKDKHAVKLRLIFKNGNRSIFPYAYIIRTDYDTSGIITLYTAEKKIILRGRGLDYVEERLYENQVKAIKESKVAIDNGLGPVFVKSIEIAERTES